MTYALKLPQYGILGFKSHTGSGSIFQISPLFSVSTSLVLGVGVGGLGRDESGDRVSEGVVYPRSSNEVRVTGDAEG